MMTQQKANERNVLVIVQARVGSKRLPSKVLLPLGDTTVLGYLMARLKSSTLSTQILVATTINPADDVLEEYCGSIGVPCFRGSEENVLERFYDAAVLASADVVVRVTADCPFIDPALVDLVIKEFTSGVYDYVSNSNPPTYPDGFDVEVFSFEFLARARSQALTKEETEHVTPWIRNNAPRVGVVKARGDWSHLRVTLDEYADYQVCKSIAAQLDPTATWEEITAFLERNPEVRKINMNIGRNEGATLGQGQKLWKHAKNVIPGGNMLLSKRPEMFLPEKWPSYFESAQGCRVTDLDGNVYVDMTIMGIGTNTLGYGNEFVDNAVRKAISKGNMSTLNAPEEVWLADELLKLNPWAGMARFARSGGEANAIAVRIARAASGRDKVAICGYHGWHDWYLSANLSSDKQLDGHLLPGLQPMGVPRDLQGTVLAFKYNDLPGLVDLVERENPGVIIMEVSRNFGPENNFLEEVRSLASAKGIVLIFDECTSGFRETFGGLHQKYAVEPDMAMYGKALGNGYAITAVLGRTEVMQEAQNTFISSTFWTERIGPSAALATLQEMARQQSWERITELGSYIRRGWQAVADSAGLTLNHWGIPALAGFTVSCADSLAAKTYITQEMLKRGFLAGNSFYASTAHDESIIDQYLDNLLPIFTQIAKVQDDSEAITSILEQPAAHGGFQRLN